MPTETKSTRPQLLDHGRPQKVPSSSPLMLGMDTRIPSSSNSSWAAISISPAHPPGDTALIISMMSQVVSRSTAAPGIARTWV